MTFKLASLVTFAAAFCTLALREFARALAHMPVSGDDHRVERHAMGDRMVGVFYCDEDGDLIGSHAVARDDRFGDDA